MIRSDMRHRPTASATRRLVECPTSACLPGFNRSTGYTFAGNDFHDAMHAIAERAADRPVLEVVAEVVSEVDDPQLATDLELLPWSRLPVGAGFASEVSFALDVSTGVARELGRGVGRDKAYADLGPFDFAGTADVVALADDHVFVADWKRGWSERTPARRHLQLMSLATMAALAYGRPTARVSLVRAPAGRTPWISYATFDGLQLGAHYARIRQLWSDVAEAASHVAQGTAEVNPGPWCQFCPATASCPAQVRELQLLARGELQRSVDDMMPLTADNFATAWRRIELLGEIVKRAKSAAILFAKSNGPIEIGDGLYVGEVISQGNEKFDGKIAHDVVTELYGRDVADECVKLESPKSRIYNALRAVAKDRGEPIAKLEREVHEQIRARRGAARKSSKSVKVFEAHEQQGVGDGG